MTSKAPSFRGLRSASRTATAAARGASRKSGTKCERLLRAALKSLALRLSTGDALPGKPDIVLRSQRVAVFCDGDFFHGRRLRERLRRLASGHNAAYWTAKLKANVARDRRVSRALRADGWLVLRFWESDIARAPDRVAAKVARASGRRERDPRGPLDTALSELFTRSVG